MKNLSIIIPTYRTPPKILERAVKSALEQTLEGIEILVYDDNDSPSEINSVRNLVEKLHADKSYHHAQSLFYIDGDGHVGPSDARKFAVEDSAGEYVTFLDADDSFYEKDSCQIMFEKIRATPSKLPDIVQGKIVVVDKNPATLAAFPDAYDYIEKSFRETLSFETGDELISAYLSEKKHSLCLEGKLFRTKPLLSALEKMPRAECFVGENYMWLYFILRECRSFSEIAIPVCRCHSENGFTFSSDAIENLEEWKKICSSSSVFTAVFADMKSRPLSCGEEIVRNFYSDLMIRFAASNLRQQMRVPDSLREKAARILIDSWGADLISRMVKKTWN